jgi:predicted kinase
LQSLCHLHHAQKTAKEAGNHIVVIVGPPCAGKSTYAKEQQKINGGVIVDFDAMAMALGATEEHNASEAIKEIALKARYAAIKEILNGIDLPAWIIETTPSDRMVDYYKRSGVIFKLLDPGKEICMQRAKKRPGDTEKRIINWYENILNKINNLI